jgi:glycosyltransferase involved in cell wall biosynthesis
MNTIYISIASYRDPQLLPTLHDCIAKANNPDNLRFGIAWQHSSEDKWDTLDEFQNDPRFTIIDIPYNESQGTCWARNLIQQNYQGEDYYLQLDSHHRFIEGWDTECIDIVEDLKLKGHEKPLLTTYAPSFDPNNDPALRSQDPWWMQFDRFIPEGAIFFLPASIPNWKELSSPIPSRFLSAHFIFTLGQWCTEVPYDPEYYFHGEEISLAVRSYTWGYDLFHPHKIIVWHEYTRNNRTKHWDDDKEWYLKNQTSHKRNRALFGIDAECRCDMEFGPYDFGTERILQQYEAYAGIRFKDRATQKYTLDHNFAPNPIITSPLHYGISFTRMFKHCIDLNLSRFPLDDYDFWVVAFEDADGVEVFRKDYNSHEVKSILNRPVDSIKIWVDFQTNTQPHKWIIWPHSLSKDWCDRVEEILPK